MSSKCCFYGVSLLFIFVCVPGGGGQVWEAIWRHAAVQHAGEADKHRVLQHEHQAGEPLPETSRVAAGEAAAGAVC